MFERVLVANRGEIAVRVIRTLRRLGISPVAVYSDADRLAPHVGAADGAVRLGPAPAELSYLDIDKVVAAALTCGAQAVHPGYGFLSENADFAAACESAGLVFVGPTPEVIRAMGDKRAAKELVRGLGVSVVPGFQSPGASDAELIEAADQLGFPVLVKPAFGGGGKGMKVADSREDLGASLASSRREARAAFGDDELLLERYLHRARHVEVQVVGDGRGVVVHLGDRDCSLQRRHQKVIEEAPAPFLPDEVRAAIRSNAVRIAAAVDYRGAGTVEFIVNADEPTEFYFLEVNTRLQVEHPVTELVTGLDLVELQLGVAAGQGLGISQDQVSISGHAVEARVYAEDAYHGLLPASGTVLDYAEPKGVRVDSGVHAGSVVGTDYDPMLLKIIASGQRRGAALTALEAALSRTTVLGVAHNIPLLRLLVRHPALVSGRMTTSLIDDQELGALNVEPDDHALVCAALVRQFDWDANSPWYSVPGWRLGSEPRVVTRLIPAAGPLRTVTSYGHPQHAQVAVDSGGRVDAAVVPMPDRAGVYVATMNGVAREYRIAIEGDVVWLGHDGDFWRFATQRRDAGRSGASDEPTSGRIRSPMPGSIVLVARAPGDHVGVGEVVAVVEAMKMEYPLTAPFDGVVETVAVTTGSQVVRDQLIAVVGAEETR